MSFTVYESFTEFRSQYPDFEEEKATIEIAWLMLPVIETRNDCKFIVTQSNCCECFFVAHAQSWSETEKGESLGHIWLSGPHVRYKNRFRTFIKEKTGLDIQYGEFGAET